MRILLPVVLLACTPEPLPEEEPVPLLPVEEVVTQRGAFAVGHRQVEVVYPAIGTGEDRTVPMEIWYPAIDGGEGPPTYGVAGLVEIEDPTVLFEPDAEPGPFPLAFYSHGAGGVGALAYPYAQLLASHGWIVVSPDHIGNTALDIVNGVDFVQTAIDRPADVTAILDAIEAGGVVDEADVSQTLLFGHSMGGYTTLAAPGVSLDLTILGCPPGSSDPSCAALQVPAVADQLQTPALDSRIRAIVPQAPALGGLFVSESLEALPIPMLMMSGRQDGTTPDSANARLVWDARSDPADRWLRLPQGGHYSFITICDDIEPELLNLFIGGIDNDGCGESFTPVSEVVPALASYTLGFGELHVRDQTRFETLFTGEANLLEDMVMRLPE